MKNQTNRTLFIVLVVLVSGFVLAKVFRSPARESNLDAKLFAIDTATIAELRIQSGSDSSQLSMKKIDGEWTIQGGEKKARVDKSALDNFMRTLVNVKPERIVSRNQEKWDTYQVTDTAAIRFTAFDGDGEELINWRVGKESRGVTYVRPDEESEVFALAGSLRSGIDKNFNEWRDKTFVRIAPQTISKITFSYPADS